MILVNDTHYDIPPRMRVDLCDKITEPIAVNHLVLGSCSAVTLLGLLRVVQDSRDATTLFIHVDLLYSYRTFHLLIAERGMDIAQLDKIIYRHHYQSSLALIIIATSSSQKIRAQTITL